MKSFARMPVWRGETEQMDSLAEEQPVAFEYNGISHAVMLATPRDLDDLAVGFSLSEGIVDIRDEIFAIESVEGQQGITLRIDIAGSAFARLKDRRRSLAGRTGCGLCGAESLAQVLREIPVVGGCVNFDLDRLLTAMTQLAANQPLQHATGATHAACHVDSDGVIRHVREDVGRHNALDKTLGALLNTGGRDTYRGGLVVTSRASYEMVHKVASLGYGLLAAVSAPTAAAVRLARQCNVTLVGFLRDHSYALYHRSSSLQELAA